MACVRGHHKYKDIEAAVTREILVCVKSDDFVQCVAQVCCWGTPVERLPNLSKFPAKIPLSLRLLVVVVVVYDFMCGISVVY